jgi:uncharacterized damage-inducible protein DinB
MLPKVVNLCRSHDYKGRDFISSGKVSMLRASITLFLIGLVGFGTTAQAQQVSVTAPLEKQYAGDLTLLHDKVLALAEAIPAERYGWRPSDQVRTVSQLLMHLAGEWFYMCPISVGAKPPADFVPPGPPMRKLEEITVKSEVVAQLHKAWTTCRAALDGVDPRRLVPDSLPAKLGFPRVVLLISGDQHEHLGQLIAYARSIGVTPPWSK